MLTATDIDRMADYAGADYRWLGAPCSTSRPANTEDRPLRDGLFALLWDVARGVCAFCGEANLYAGAAVCHVVSAGPKRDGYMPGNLAWGCHGCNELDRQRGAVVQHSTIVRPDLIAKVWPDRDTLLSLGRAVRRMEGKPWPVEPKPRGLAMVTVLAASLARRP